MSVTLRAVRNDELPLLAEVLGELDGEASLPLPALQARLAALRAIAGSDCYFAEHAGEVIGSLSLIVVPLLSSRHTCEVIAESVVVRTACRGRGLGRAMMQAAIAQAAAAGAYKLALSSNLRRLDAHRFYEGMGFARHGYSFSIDTTAAQPVPA